jgi:hypothetical protein
VPTLVSVTSGYSADEKGNLDVFDTRSPGALSSRLARIGMTITSISGTSSLAMTCGKRLPDPRTQTGTPPFSPLAFATDWNAFAALAK